MSLPWYVYFSVAPESENYKLTVARYTSDSHAGDALKWHNGMKFSTPDRDNDVLLGEGKPAAWSLQVIIDPFSDNAMIK